MIGFGELAAVDQSAATASWVRACQREWKWSNHHLQNTNVPRMFCVSKRQAWCCPHMGELSSPLPRHSWIGPGLVQSLSVCVCLSPVTLGGNST